MVKAASATIVWVSKPQQDDEPSPSDKNESTWSWAKMMEFDEEEKKFEICGNVDQISGSAAAKPV